MASPKYDLFISHNWGMDTVNRDNHKRVARLNKALVAANLTTWFDENQMKGNVGQAMSNGIDGSRKVLVCITKRYMDKVAGKMGNDDNCRKEFDYSAMKKGLENIIPVVMEHECLDLTQWHGPIDLSLANQLYNNFTKNSQLSSCVWDIVKEIGHDIGQLIDKSGQVYIGEFRVNKIFGKGKMKYKDERVYNGEWVDGKRVGRGEMWDINNNRYNGEWIANRRCGQGTLHYKSGDVYTGSFRNGMIDGKGVTKYKNGAEYDGEYKKNKKHGQGKYTFSDGHHFYNGEWKMNKRHGNGVRLYKNGDIYDGAFVNNMREGQGTIMIKETGIVYQGTWLADAMHGSGFCVVENNDTVKVKKSRFGFFSDKKVKQVKVEFDNNSLTSSKRVKEKRRWGRRRKSDNDSEIVSLPDDLLAVKSQEDQMSIISQEV